MKPLHRDDLPMNVAEGIVEQMKQAFPGMEVVFAGDMPGDLPESVKEGMAALEKKMERSLCEGRCIDCDAEMEGFPKSDATDDFWDNWQPAKGWKHFKRDGDIVAWQCPKCDAAENSPPPAG